MTRRRTTAIFLTAAMLLAGPLYVPEALAFPFHVQVRGASVWSEVPIPPAIDGVLARADTLVRASPLDGPATGRRIFLTDGGWRWRWLAIGAAGAFGLTRPVSEAIVVNRNDVATDRATNGAAIAGTRSLSGVIAHERTHGLIRARYGLVAATLFPAWQVEGYCDHVAGGGSLSDAEAARLERAGENPSAMLYYHGRRRVEALLAGGGSVDRVFGR